MKNEMFDYEKEMNRELENRIAQIANEDQETGKQFGKLDWLFVFLILLSGLIIILLGKI